MKKIFLVYGHYNENSFNAAIRDTFIKTAESKGNKVDAIDLYKEKFNPVFAGEEPGEDVINHDAAKVAEEAGLKVVRNKCPKIELFRPFWKPRLDLKI